PGGKIDDASALGQKRCAREHDDGISAIAGHRGEGAVELIGSSHLYELKLDCKSPGRHLCCQQHVSRCALAESPGMRRHGGRGAALGEATRPYSTGSPITATTTGVVVVACWTARAAGVFWATMRSSLREASSFARRKKRSILPSAHRYSMRMLCPSK